MSSSKTTLGENESYVMEAIPLDTDGSALTGQTIAYDIINAATEASIGSGTLSEVGVTGVYKGTTSFSAKGNYRIVYSSGTYPDGYESIIVDDVNTDVELIRKIENNRWKLDASANTMTIYDDDDSTPLIVFDMKDASGTASVNRIFERFPQ